jgi:hypothetical protein
MWLFDPPAAGAAALAAFFANSKLYHQLTSLLFALFLP